jgi:hypothetical protein
LRTLEQQPRVDRVDRIGGVDDAPSSAHLNDQDAETKDAP